jgi:hypothetical protein
MKRFDNTRLWEVLKTSDNPSPDPKTDPDDLFDEFIAVIYNHCREEKNMAERNRSLNYVHGKLIACAEECATDAKFLKTLLRRAILFIESEIDLAKMEVEHPERFIVFAGDNSTPLFRWNGKPHELLEYVMPLQISGKLLKPSGEPMNFSEMVKIFESMCGITVAKPHDIRMRLLTRKKNIAPFIDKMRLVLKNASEKSYL